MVNSEHGEHPLDVIEAITLIAKTNFIRLTGLWHLTPSGSTINVRPESYDYLVQVRDTNFLVHPDDTGSITKLINPEAQQINTQLKIRLINPSGHVQQLEGYLNLFDALSTGADGVLTDRAGATVDSIAEKRLRKSFGVIFPEDDADKRNAIENLIAGKNLLEAVFNTSTLGLHVLQSVRDEKGNIIDFDILLTNATSNKIAGRKVSGLRMLEGWPHTKEIGLFDRFVQVVNTGKKLEYEHLYEGDGVRAWFQWIASQLGDGLYVTIENITERKEAEEAVKKTAARLQSTFDGVPAIIALLDVVLDEAGEPVDFIISAANKATSDLRGDKQTDLLGKRMTDFYPEAFRGRLKESYLDVFRTGEATNLEYLYPGLERWFSIFVTKQIDGKGIVVAAIEITAQKKSEEQRQQNLILTELNQAKTEFFSNVSHEFRTPLTLMLGPIQEMTKKFGAAPMYADYLPMLQMVYRNALRLEKLVNTLLNFSHIEAGRSDAVFKPTDIAEYTTLLAGNFRSAIETAGLKFVVDCESTEPIYLNQDMWEKIVLNLLSNAFKFTFTGKIEVRLRSLRRHVKLEIRDTGIGIKSSDHPRIFERFTRIPNARSRSYEGTGIGLALVKELVKMHGGDIQVKSNEGQGSTFLVSIPKGKRHLPAKNIYELREKTSVSPMACIYANEAMSWMPAATEDPMLVMGNQDSSFRSSQDRFSNAQNTHILLVDDNSDIREYITSILKAQYKVIAAHNGTKAMALIESGFRPDLILADLMMPEMNGFELLSRIRENEMLASTPFIMLSARASEEDKILGMRYGVDDYLIKPFSSVALLALVNSRIRRRMTNLQTYS